MRRWVSSFAFIIAILGLVSWQPAQADSGAQCTSDPTAGAPGTRFEITCTGFTPNTYVNTYVVEPDGRAVSGAQIVGVFSNVGSGNILTDKQGNARFAWQSEGGTRELGAGGTFAHQLGIWTWVVHQPNTPENIILNGQAQITLQSVNWEQIGATLNTTQQDSHTFHFNGAGFWQQEYVNLWVTLPPNCSGRSNVEGVSAEDPYYQGLFDGFFGPNTVKANAGGEIDFTLVFTAVACRGEYHATAYAPGSGYGAIATFQVSGDAITISSEHRITTAPASVDALNPFVTILGSDWHANEMVSCWSTRPDGRTFNLGDIKSDATGTFALDTHLSGFDSSAPLASEEPGVWSVTCRAVSDGGTALTNLTVHALTVDP